MTTLLFFDDQALAVRDHVIRGVGRPTVVPESVWHDDERRDLDPVEARILREPDPTHPASTTNQLASYHLTYVLPEP